MSEQLQIARLMPFEGGFGDMEQPVWQKSNEQAELIKNTKNYSENVDPESDYDDIADLSQFTDEGKDVYESFTDDPTIIENMMVVPEEIKTYSLIEQLAPVNSLVASTRFDEDIIFSSVGTDRLFEVGASCLSVAIVASMLLLPAGFNTGTSLVLSAPLFVCACGILAKYTKRRS